MTEAEAIRPGQKGYKPSPELMAKMAAGRARKRAERKGAKPTPVKTARPARLAKGSTPDRAAGGITAVMRKKMDALVGKFLGWTESGLLFGAHRFVNPPDAFDADKLEPWERSMLAEAIVTECIRYPRLRKFLMAAVEFDDRTGLPVVIMIIALPRMAAHGLIPAEFTAMVAELSQAAKAARRRGRPLAEMVIQAPDAPEPEEPETPEVSPEPARAVA